MALTRQTILLPAIVLLSLASCYSANMANVKIAPASTAKGELVVAVLDHRPYVVSGNKTPAFVGIVRGGYGNPFNISTSSGRPLAADLAQAVADGFKNSGAAASVLDTAPAQSAAQVIASFRSRAASRRLLLIELREWKSDSMTDGWFIVDASANVYDRSGSSLGQSSIKERQPMEGSFWSPGSAAERNSVSGAERYLNQLLSNPAISSALAR